MKLFIAFFLMVALIPFSITCHAEGSTVHEVKKKEIRDISLGMHITELPVGRYKDYACVDPDKALETLDKFEDCPVNNLNLHEVRLKYDHSDNEWSEVGDRFSGTRISGHPVVLSILVDDEGVIQGIRANTNPDASPFTKKQAYLLSGNIKNHYGNTGWKCVEKQPGEEVNKPVGPVYIDNVCSKVMEGKRIRVETKLYRRPNQTGKEHTNSSALEIISLMAVRSSL